MGATVITAILSHQKSDVVIQIVRKSTVLSLSLEFRFFFFTIIQVCLPLQLTCHSYFATVWKSEDVWRHSIPASQVLLNS